MTSNGYATGTGGNITITKSGIYYTDGDISLNNASVAAGVKVTFVANGQISVNGSGNFTAYENITGHRHRPRASHVLQLPEPGQRRTDMHG
jgi:hypothetical protein